jgi:hypothetical protein
MRPGWRRLPRPSSPRHPDGFFIVRTLDAMLSMNRLTPDRHSDIRAWARRAKTPEKIMQMPPHLWRRLALTCVLMGFDVGEDASPEVGP